MILYSSIYHSPFTEIHITVNEDGSLHRLMFDPDQRSLSDFEKDGVSIVADEQKAGEVVKQLDEYFSHKRKSFDLKLNPIGTDFQKIVWKELINIPYGRAISYGELAKRIGNPNASRAVGSANNKNPIPIIIPCHRVIGANGELVGYASGLDIKQNLLTHEGYLSNNLF